MTVLVMMLFAVCSTFMGLVTDLIQQAMGLHEQRLRRLIDTLERHAKGEDDARLALPDPYIARAICGLGEYRPQDAAVITVYADEQALHDGKAELTDGQLLPCFEQPRRAPMIRDGFGRLVSAPSCRPRIRAAARSSAHAPAFVDFLATAWERWTAMGRIDARCLRPGPSGTWAGRRPNGSTGSSAGTASTPRRRSRPIPGVPSTPARRPRHGGTAHRRWAGTPPSPCPARRVITQLPISTAATASSATPPSPPSTCWITVRTVAILDVDYHHGNGTQAIFYDRPDVLFVSLHAHPSVEFPTSWAGRTRPGSGQGRDSTATMPSRSGRPSPPGATPSRTRCAGSPGTGRMPVVSLGVDTYRGDPISQFALDCDDFTAYGGLIARLRLPTLFVMEGGYAWSRRSASTR